MVYKASRYYREPFQGSCGVTQGGPIPPWICNFVVGVIVCHWVGLVEENYTGPGGFGYTVEEKADFFTQMTASLPPPT